MHSKILLAVFLLFSLNLISSDSSDSSSEEQAKKISELTTNEVADFLSKRDAVEKWDQPKKCLEGMGWAAGVLLVVGGVTGVVVSSIFCPEGMSEPGCIGGLSCFVPAVGLGLGTLAIATTVCCQNLCAQKYNERYRKKYKKRFTVGQSEAKGVESKDLRDLGDVLSQNLLKKLSPAQALALAEGELLIFRKHASDDDFSYEANEAAIRLLHMIDSEWQELAANLKSAEVHSMFKSEPVLLQTLVRILHKDERISEEIQQGLSCSLKALLGDQVKINDEKLNQIIYKIAQGTSIHDYLLGMVKVVCESSEDEADCQTVQLITTKGNILVNRQNLIGISNYFKAAFSQKWSSKKAMDLTKINAEWIEIIVSVANGEFLVVDADNLGAIMAAGNYFEARGVMKHCDRFIHDHKLLSQVLKECQDEILPEESKAKDFDPKSFATRWNFCHECGLEQTKKTLIPELIDRLNDLTIGDDTTINDLSLLDADNLADLIKDFKLLEFKKKLQNPQFLKWFWEQVQDFDFLKNAVVRFCKAEKNHMIVVRAWLVMPKDLAALIEENNPS